MTWLYVPSASALASEPSTSESALLDPTRAVSLSWRGKQAQPRAWSQAWKRGGFIRLLSGLTSEPLTLDHGAASGLRAFVRFEFRFADRERPTSRDALARARQHRG